MKFGVGEVCHGGIYWAVIGDIFASYCDNYSVSIFLLWSDVSDDASLGDLYIMGQFMPMNEKTGICNLYIPNSLEELDHLIGN